MGHDHAKDLHIRLKSHLKDAHVDLVQRFPTHGKAQDTALHALEVTIRFNKFRYDQTAVVFDIDETLLFYKGDRYNHSRIASMVKFLHAVRRLAHVYLVTARLNTSHAREFTVKELASHGVQSDQYNALFMCPAEYRMSAQLISDFKLASRLVIEKTYRHHVLMTVGDRFGDHVKLISDIDHFHAENDCVLFRVRNKSAHATVVCFKLPAKLN
jgi:predicted secreted acid phosphatase